MRVSKEKAAQNRQQLIGAAAKLFREKGIASTGVAEIAGEAGLTHGALYKHFPTKDALAAEAFTAAFADVSSGIDEWKAHAHPDFDDYLDVLISARTRDRVSTGCPMTASASEIGRQGAELSARFAAAFTELAAIFESGLDPALPADRRHMLATTAAAAQIGAVAVARAVEKSDDELSEYVLAATRSTLSRAARRD